MTSMEWRSAPLTVDTDPLHGGRWTSLRTDHREWLWTNPDPETARARRSVTPASRSWTRAASRSAFRRSAGNPTTAMHGPGSGLPQARLPSSTCQARGG